MIHFFFIFTIRVDRFCARGLPKNAAGKGTLCLCEWNVKPFFWSPELIRDGDYTTCSKKSPVSSSGSQVWTRGVGSNGRTYILHACGCCPSFDGRVKHDRCLRETSRRSKQQRWSFIIIIVIIIIAIPVTVVIVFTYYCYGRRVSSDRGLPGRRAEWRDF